MHVVPKAQLPFVPAPTRSALSFSGCQLFQVGLGLSFGTQKWGATYSGHF